MELKENMYVRTKNGIVKIDKIQNDVMKDTKGCLHYGDFIKASHNIIDLIEVGDYVNGKLVSSLPLFKNEFIFEEPVNGVKYVKGIVGTPIEDNKDNFIKSIVTKEQFSQMAYKIGD